MKFKSRKDIFFQVLLYGTCLLLGYVIFRELVTPQQKTTNYLIVILLSIVIFLILSIMLNTHYILNNTHLRYRSSFLRGNIPLDKITELEVGNTMWVGFKPATARYGIVVKYSRFNSIYISPDSNDAFIKKITELKPDIIITNYK